MQGTGDEESRDERAGRGERSREARRYGRGEQGMKDEVVVSKCIPFSPYGDGDDEDDRGARNDE
jgi:hypothetical protein